MNLNARNHSQASSRNTTNASSWYNSLIWILEWAEWSMILREKIYKHLETLITWKGSIQIKQSLKDTNSLRSAITLVASYLNSNIAWKTIQEKNNFVINKIKENVLDKEDLSESAIIRLSALNRFEVELTPKQNLTLHKIEDDLMKIVEDKIPDMKSSLNFKEETNAQRIQKVSEMINFLSKKWLLTEYPEWFEEINNLLSPLKDLDQKYHQLNQARNRFYDIQRWYSEVEVLNNTQEKKLEIALNTLTGKNLQTYFETDIKPNLTTIDLNHLIDLIKISNPDIQDKIKSLNMRVWDFEKYFLFYFSTQILKRTKIEFEMKKSEVIKDKRRDFEADVKTWREIQRNRLVELCNNVVWPTWPKRLDLDQIENIFNRDRKLFLRTWDETNDTYLRTALIQLFNRKYLTATLEVREALADAIMNENEATNKLYYWHENDLLSDKNDKWAQSFLKATWNAWRNIQKVWEYTTPIVWWFVKFWQKALEKVSSWVSSVITTTTWATKKVIWDYNTWANKKAETFLWRVVKFPFKASQVLTRPLWWWVGALDFTANKWSELVSWTYNWLNEIIKSATNDKVDNLFDVFTQTYKYALNLTGSWTAWSWDKAFDMLKTSQKREILSEFYQSRNIWEVRSLLESIDIESRIKDSSPYIFDNDWFDDLWYEVKEEKENSNEIKTLSWKVSKLLLKLNNDKSKDEDIYSEIIYSFEWINEEIEDNSKLETDKFKAIKSIITLLIKKFSIKSDEIKKERSKIVREKNKKEKQINAWIASWLDMTSLQNASDNLWNKIDELDKRLQVLIALWIDKKWGIMNDTFIRSLEKFWVLAIEDDWSLNNDYDDLLNNISL